MAIPCCKGKNLNVVAAFFPVHAPSALDAPDPGFIVDPQPHPLPHVTYRTGAHHFHLTCVTPALEARTYPVAWEESLWAWLEDCLDCVI